MGRIFSDDIFLLNYNAKQNNAIVAEHNSNFRFCDTVVAAAAKINQD